MSPETLCRDEVFHVVAGPVRSVRHWRGPWRIYAILIGNVGARRVRTVYRRHELAITRIGGVMFTGFTVSSLAARCAGVASEQGLRLRAGLRQLQQDILFSGVRVQGLILTAVPLDSIYL